jgi:RNA polymerase sigma-70 factor (ECF subfamily)
MRKRSLTTDQMHALMVRYVDGDNIAFNELLTRLGPKLRRYVGRRVKNPDIADDVYQQVLVRIHVSRARYMDHPPVEGRAVERWFMAAAQRAVLDHLRGEYRRAGRLDRLTRYHDTAGFGAPIAPLNPEEQLDTSEHCAEVHATLEAALAKLPPDSEEVVRRHKLQGQSMQQIASDIGIAASTLRVRAHRAYRKLAKHLGGGMVQPA